VESVVLGESFPEIFQPVELTAAQAAQRLVEGREVWVWGYRIVAIGLIRARTRCGKNLRLDSVRFYDRSPLAK
jgi:hypothetical protein